MKWQPIDSAPRCKTPLMLYRPKHKIGENGRLVIGVPNPHGKGWAWPDDVYDEYDDEAIHEAVGKGFCFESDEFTHWRPRPAMPNNG